MPSTPAPISSTSRSRSLRAVAWSRRADCVARSCSSRRMWARVRCMSAQAVMSTAPVSSAAPRAASSRSVPVNRTRSSTPSSSMPRIRHTGSAWVSAVATSRANASSASPRSRGRRQ